MGEPADEERIASLDMLRGIAVIGILFMNIAGFALPPAAYDYPSLTAPAGMGDLAVWAIGFVLIDGKMRALFSILFGASLLIVCDRAEAAGRSAARTHLARMGWLLAIGLAHLLLIWSGDILTLYALVGAAAFAFRRKEPGELLVAALLCLAAQAIVLSVDLAGLEALRDAASRTDAPVAARAAWRAAVDTIGPGDGSAPRAAIALMRGGYGAILHDRLRGGTGMLVEQIETAGLETLGLMLLGMAALRSGAITGGWPIARLRRIAGAGVAIGVTGEAALLARCLARGLDPLAVYGAATLGGAPFRPLLALGYAACALVAAQKFGVPHRLAAAGRMALSNYLATSLVCTTLFYGYGVGLYARLSRAELLLPAVAIAATMPLWSAAWLRGFRYGPAEWLWRSLARGRLQPMRNRLANKSQ